MKQVLPWILAAALAVTAAALHFHYRSALEAKSAELAALQEKYTKLESESSSALNDTRSKLEATQAKLVDVATEASKKIQEVSAQAEAQTRAIAEEADARLKQANLPEATVLAGFRKALMSSGSVAGVRNASSSAISITLTATRPSTGQSKAFRLVVDPGATKEIGEQEGWAFVKGDQIKVEQPGHKPKTWTLN